jgi:hypothetical protein
MRCHEAQVDPNPPNGASPHLLTPEPMPEINTISEDRMDSFIEIIINQAREALQQRKSDMLRAWHENIEESQANDKKFPPLNVAIKGGVDLEAATIETTVRFSATYQSTITSKLPDPEQPEFPNL